MLRVPADSMLHSIDDRTPPEVPSQRRRPSRWDVGAPSVALSAQSAVPPPQAPAYQPPPVPLTSPPSFSPAPQPPTTAGVPGWQTVTWTTPPFFAGCPQEVAGAPLSMPISRTAMPTAPRDPRLMQQVLLVDRGPQTIAPRDPRLAPRDPRLAPRPQAPKSILKKTSSPLNHDDAARAPLPPLRNDDAARTLSHPTSVSRPQGHDERAVAITPAPTASIGPTISPQAPSPPAPAETPLLAQARPSKRPRADSFAAERIELAAREKELNVQAAKLEVLRAELGGSLEHIQAIIRESGPVLAAYFAQGEDLQQAHSESDQLRGALASTLEELALALEARGTLQRDNARLSDALGALQRDKAQLNDALGALQRDNAQLNDALAAAKRAQADPAAGSRLSPQTQSAAQALQELLARFAPSQP